MVDRSGKGGEESGRVTPNAGEEGSGHAKPCRDGIDSMLIQSGTSKLEPRRQRPEIEGAGPSLAELRRDKGGPMYTGSGANSMSSSHARP